MEKFITTVTIVASIFTLLWYGAVTYIGIKVISAIRHDGLKPLVMRIWEGKP